MRGAEAHPTLMLGRGGVSGGGVGWEGWARGERVRLGGVGPLPSRLVLDEWRGVGVTISLPRDGARLRETRASKMYTPVTAIACSVCNSLFFSSFFFFLLLDFVIFFPSSSSILLLLLSFFLVLAFVLSSILLWLLFWVFGFWVGTLFVRDS